MSYKYSPSEPSGFNVRRVDEQEPFIPVSFEKDHRVYSFKSLSDAFCCGFFWITFLLNFIIVSGSIFLIDWIIETSWFRFKLPPHPEWIKKGEIINWYLIYNWIITFFVIAFISSYVVSSYLTGSMKRRKLPNIDSEYYEHSTCCSCRSFSNSFECLPIRAFIFTIIVSLTFGTPIAFLIVWQYETIPIWTYLIGRIVIFAVMAIYIHIITYAAVVASPDPYDQQYCCGCC